ncbi:DNA-binding response regulator [Brevibacillus nitrificans]|uniref:Heme response regulator HssR n=1 Tax=Brevibacillus nitrificans TaxID=651560 RepID=A0A3M8DAX3_9BACL|nr:response regulator transcription factor [Brevibacillus nitrificans]RNB84407.1 DNA-binding response regulator [Brevibacillus nitrificans]
MVTVLIVDDDPHIRELVQWYLKKEGYKTLEAHNGKEALLLLETNQIDLVVLDIMMPEMDGWEFCKACKEERDIPIMMVTAIGEPNQRIKGFQLGTDDYLVKPFEPLELVLRVKALLKRYRIQVSETIQVGNVVIQRLTREVFIDNKVLPLPPKEFDLLEKLASYPGQIFTRTALIEGIWGMDFEGDDRTIDVHIKRLREKFAEVTDSFKITTVRGLGYRLEVQK